MRYSIEYRRIEAWPADRTKRSRSGQSGSAGSWRMTRLNSTWASGARAMAVPGWPELALRGASMAKPRMTSIARSSRSCMVLLAVMRRSCVRPHPSGGGRGAKWPGGCRACFQGSTVPSGQGRTAYSPSAARRLGCSHSGCVGGSDEVLERRTVARPAMAGPPLRFGGGVGGGGWCGGAVRRRTAPPLFSDGLGVGASAPRSRCASSLAHPSEAGRGSSLGLVAGASLGGGWTRPGSSR